MNSEFLSIDGCDVGFAVFHVYQLQQHLVVVLPKQNSNVGLRVVWKDGFNTIPPTRCPVGRMTKPPAKRIASPAKSPRGTKRAVEFTCSCHRTPLFKDEFLFHFQPKIFTSCLVRMVGYINSITCADAT